MGIRRFALISNSTRRTWWAGAAAAIALVAAACGGGSTSSSPGSFKGTIRIGYSGALTGQSQLYGHAISQSIKLAADDINSKGGINSYKVETDVLDDGTTVEASPGDHLMIDPGHLAEVIGDETCVLVDW